MVYEAGGVATLEPTPATRTLPPCALASAGRRRLRVGLLGCGTVGGAVARRLADADLGDAGPAFDLAAVAVRHPGKQRGVALAGTRVTTDPFAVAIDPDVDVVVETIGGIDLARDLVVAALCDGKSVVTANKALVARHGDELTGLASRRGLELRYEAAVGGAVPALGVVRHGVGDMDLRRIVGVLNGTTNYLLGLIGAGVDPDQALDDARAAGLAERDADADLDGSDAAAKAAILAQAAWGTPLRGAAVERSGIHDLTTADLRAAAAVGCEVKLLATVLRHGDHVDVSVGPAAVDAAHPLARVGGAGNGLVFETQTAGSIVVSGPGAGGDATAGAVLSDLAHVARRHLHGAPAEAAPSRARLVLGSCRVPVPAWFVRLPGRGSEALTTGRSLPAVHGIGTLRAGLCGDGVALVVAPGTATSRAGMAASLERAGLCPATLLPIEGEISAP